MIPSAYKMPTWIRVHSWNLGQGMLQTENGPKGQDVIIQSYKSNEKSNVEVILRFLG